MTSEQDETFTTNNENAHSFISSIFSIIYDARKYSIITRGFAEILHRELTGSLNEDQKEMAYELIRRATMLSHIVEQGVLLLDIDISQTMRKPDLHQLDKIIENAMAYAANRNRPSYIPPIHYHADPAIFVYASDDDVTRILVQLLDNAIKYTPQTGEIFIETEVLQEMTAISVQDTGAGIPPERQSKLFQRLSDYSQIMPNVLSGARIGLALAQSLAQRNNGSLFLAQTSEQGSTFTIMLPKQQSNGS